MCWSEATSIVTFLLGSIINVFAYTYLTYKKSPSNILVFYWQFTLLMQIPEAITWNYINNDIDVYGPSRIAMILNVFQPIALFLCVINGINNAFSAIFMYLLLILSDYQELWAEGSDISPQKGCEHLNLGYWNLSRSLLYVFSSMICFVSFENKFWGWFNMFIFLSTLVVSVLIYNCGGGSMWCWMISMSGLVLITAEYFQIYDFKLIKVISSLRLE